MEMAMTVQAIFQQGMAAQQRGDHAEAMVCYRRVIALNGDHYPALHLLGALTAGAGRSQEAIALISRSLALNPKSPSALCDLGLVLQGLRRSEEALGHFDAAIALKPDLATAHFNRGGALKALGRLDEALESYDTAIRLKPDLVDAHNNRGNLLRALGRLDEALASYGRAVSIRSDFPEAHFGRGVTLVDLGRLEEALAAFDALSALQPQSADAFVMRGNVLRGLGRLEEALAHHDTAVRLRPDAAEAHDNRGVTLQALDRSEEALVAHERALALAPGHAKARAHRGAALHDLGRIDEAVQSYRQAVRLDPEDADTHGRLGAALRDLGRHDEALAAYDAAIARRADFTEALWSKGTLLLSQGRMAEGWSLFEARGNITGQRAGRSFGAPRWTGAEDLSGKRLFLFWEQGFGDTLQFCRYVGLARARAAHVVLSVQAPLERLLGQYEPGVSVVGPDAAPEGFDFECPLMSLPRAFGTTLDTIPCRSSYLRADAELVMRWRRRLPGKRKPRIGLAWSGSPTNAIDAERSVPLEQLSPVLSAGVEWICLQKEIRESDLPVFERAGNIHRYDQEIADFADTAAIIDQMDLVISVDSAVAHLAGALGKPVWVLLSPRHDFRWLLEREDSPWYASARLFRRARDGGWSDCIERLGRELRRLGYGGGSIP